MTRPDLDSIRAETLEYPRNTRLIWKFPLRPWSIFIDIPEGATILSAGAQGDDVVVWARCNPNAPKVSRLVAAHPTGVRIPPALGGLGETIDESPDGQKLGKSGEVEGSSSSGRGAL